MIIEKFEKDYDEIIRKRNEGLELSEDMRKYVLKVLKEIIDSWEEMDIFSREKLGEEAGEISIKLFGMDDLKSKNKLDEIISQLLDIENSEAMKEIDRISFIKKVYKDLKDF